ncbi:hypothetical protein BC629DRAFT_1584384 [Irpex lacteus]|nr:hypothetical protein BC629DRAFT_1584384 [Irpex lacteus]
MSVDTTRYIVPRGQLPPVPQFGCSASCDANANTFSQPPLDGSLCTSEIYEWHAQHSPNHPLFQYRVQADVESVTTILYKDAVKAIYRGGWFLRGALEGTGRKVEGREKRPIIAVIALSEFISYALTWLAAERAGFTLFPISPRNSPAAIAHLLSQVDVELVLVGREEAVKDLAKASFERLRASNVRIPPVADMPAFSVLFSTGNDAQEVEPLPPVDYEAGDVSLIMHSSGSTAFPKPIRWTFFRMIAAARMCYYGEVNMTGMRIASHSLPMYHGMGISQLLWAGAIGTTILCQDPTNSPRVCSPTEMLHDANALGCDLLICTPNFAEEWAKSPEAVDMLKRTRGLMFGGGPLGKDSGDFLVSNGISLYPVYGCTEFGTVNTILPKESLEDWEYFSFAKPVITHWISDENVPGTSRLVLMAGELCSPVVMNTEIDGVGGFDTNDLFASHPTKPGLWRVYGRADDQIMHSIGEKTNPGPLEAILNLDTHVAHAIIFGRGRFNAGVLIDPIPELKFDPEDEDKLAAFRNVVWPTVERMNQYAPQHSRIFKEMILVTSPHKPFSYTSKGAPRRHAIIEDYAPEIDTLYAAVEESAQVEVDQPTPQAWDAVETNRFVRALVTKVLGKSVDDAQDLFQHGCDSLQATWIRNSLLHALRLTSCTNARSIPINFVYDNPSVSQLSDYLASTARSPENRAISGTAAVQAMHETLAKYTQDFPVHCPEEERTPIGDTVLVTGTTGGLGCALLSQLYESQDVVKVYAVNRKGKSSLKERQQKALLDKGYDADAIVDSSKVVLLEADLAQPLISLPSELYEEVSEALPLTSDSLTNIDIQIRSSVTHIIHNAWPVNFNLNLDFFEPNIRGVRNLIDLALRSPHATPPRLLFISSIGVLRRVDHSRPIKEKFVDASVAVGTGYSESKWICEQLLALASQKTALPSISVRAGQIAGSENGAWNVHEWNVSWMNVTSFASAILEARNVPTELSPLHLAHPRPILWNTLFEPVRAKYNLGLVPYNHWFAKLAASAEDITEMSTVLALNPAVKLLSFFSAYNNSTSLSLNDSTGCHQECDAGCQKSLSVERLPCLGPADMLRWLNYWERTGFLPSSLCSDNVTQYCTHGIKT